MRNTMETSMKDWILFFLGNMCYTFFLNYLFSLLHIEVTMTIGWTFVPYCILLNGFTIFCAVTDYFPSGIQSYCRFSLILTVILLVIGFVVLLNYDSIVAWWMQHMLSEFGTNMEVLNAV